MRQPGSARLQELADEGYPFVANLDEERGTFTFTNTDKREVAPDELLGMYLEYVHALAKADAPGSVACTAPHALCSLCGEEHMCPVDVVRREAWCDEHGV